MVKTKKRFIFMILTLTILVSTLVIGAITVSAEGTDVVSIPNFENGSVTADKESYNVGDTVTLTVSPADGFAQKLYINGEVLLVDTNSKYSFTVEEGKTYKITGEFVAKSDWFWTADYGMLNQAHGYIHASAVSEKNGELVPTKYGCYGGRVLLTDPSKGTKADYGVYLKMAFSNGESTSIRLVAKDSNGNYFIQAMGGILGDQWKWYYDLSKEENAAIRNGEGVWFGLALEGNTLKVTVNGVVRNRADITPTLAEGVTIEQFKVQTYNYGYAVDLMCDFYRFPVSVTMGEFANGTVTADKDSYKVGDTVTLTITPAAGHFQKLYINGEPLMLGWKTFKYSFVATERVYEITGSFETGLGLKPGDWGRWDDHNQLHGVLNTYYPSNGDSWWMDINGNYHAIEITAKNLVPKADSMDGNGQNGYMQIIRFGLSNGKTYAFRIYNDKGTYAVSCTEVSNSVSGWGNWKNVAGVLGYSIDDAMAGDGVQFKVERTAADTLTISVNGVTMFDYKMDGVTKADKVTFVGTQSNANKGKYVAIPFALTSHDWVDATCTAPKTCAVCGATEGTATGHSHTGVQTTAPTCTTKGVMTYTCSCGDSYTKDIDATGHTYETEVTAPTCTEAGYTTYTCSCDDTYTEAGAAATGHTIVDGKCACGYAATFEEAITGTGTVTLSGNIEYDGSIVLASGAKIDLNGKNLTVTGNLITFAAGQLIDSVGGGKIYVTKNGIAYNDTNATNVLVYNAEGYYSFKTIKKQSTQAKVEYEEANKIAVDFRPAFVEDGHKVSFANAEAAGLEMFVTITWGEGMKEYKVPVDLLKNVYTKGTSIRLVLVNVNPAVDYTITLTIVSDTGYAYTDVLGTVKNGVYTKN